jgi:PAS domain-containing protein
MLLEESVTIATFPRDDAAFAAFVRATLAALPAADRANPLLVQQAIRRWHTRALVRPRDEMAGFGPATWYVYRDGQAGVRSEDGWWQRDDVATAVLGEDEVFVDGDDEACRLVGRPPGGLRGVPWRDLVPSEARDDDARWLFDGLKDVPFVHSVFDAPLPDGGRRVIEYRTSWEPERRVYLCRWRELAVIDDVQIAALTGRAADEPPEPAEG